MALEQLYLETGMNKIEKGKANNYTRKNGKPYKHKFDTGEELYKWWVVRD